MSESDNPKPEQSTVAYHPDIGTAIEIYDLGGVLVADLPSGEQVTHRKASKVLHIVLDSDEILVREVGS